MPYCKSCGAYIPDGLSACLACGYDEDVQKSAAFEDSGTAAREAANDDLREVMDRHRKLQQEKNRQWAEKEKERREQQASNQRWAQEEYARRQAQRELEEEERRRQEEQRRWEERIREEQFKREQRIREEQRKAEERIREERRRREQQHREAQYQQRAGASVNEITEGQRKGLSIISYLSILFILPFFAATKDEFVMFHARQGARLFLFGLLCDVISGIFPIGAVLTIFRLYCIFKGIKNVTEGKMEPLPFIGTIQLK